MDVSLVSVLIFLLQGCLSVSMPVFANTMTTSFLHPNSTTVLNLWTCLPSKWNKICDVDYDVDADVNATLNCHVTPGALWRLADLRLALGNLVQSTGLEVRIDRLCCYGSHRGSVDRNIAPMQRCFLSPLFHSNGHRSK